MGLKSRRELLAGGLGIGAVTAAFGPGSTATAAESAGSQLADRQRDLRALEDLASGENLLQYCYTQVLESKALKSASTNVVLVAYGHEQAHAAAIQAAIATVRQQIAGLEMGLPRVRRASPPSSRRNHSEPFPPPQIATLFQHLHHEAFCITQLSRVEAYVQGKYFHAISELSEHELIRLATQILACKAQQWSLYQNLLSHGRVLHTVPHAEVRGSATLPK
jgi:hypothetical protein